MLLRGYRHFLLRTRIRSVNVIIISTSLITRGPSDAIIKARENITMPPEKEKDVESRFAYLLQPIRDLAKNWDVDVASQLEDYISEVP